MSIATLVSMPLQTRTKRVSSPIIGLLLLAIPFSPSAAQDTNPPQPDRPPRDNPAADDNRKRGLVIASGEACPGYTLFAPLQSTTTYLVDMQGNLVHSWPSRFQPGQSVHLLPDGKLLRCARQPNNRHFHGGGIGGRIERLAPDGAVEWEYVLADETRCSHHDARAMPNGNVLLIAWEKKSREEALAAGRDPATVHGDEFWPDYVVEIEPQGADDGRVVWEWHAWDHLVQSLDKSKPNYGDPADAPGRIDINARGAAPRQTPRDMRRLRGLGYVGGADDDNDAAHNDAPDSDDHRDDAPPRRGGPGPGRFGPDRQADWLHINAIDYNPTLDQIALSVHSLNEIWIIDHSTTTAEAASSQGGRGGRGGDLLYRWGNPQTYSRGGPRDQLLFAQHDVRWIPDGLPGAGNLTVFNNGLGRPAGPWSSVVEIKPPIDAAGRYRLEAGRAFGPSRPTWEYVAEEPTSLYSSHISGAQRLPNGNTLICSGEQGRIVEVSPAGKIVWEYWNPYLERSGPPDGPLGPPPGAPDRGDDRARRRMPPGGRFGPGGLFRASRVAETDPGLRRLFAAIGRS